MHQHSNIKKRVNPSKRRRIAIDIKSGLFKNEDDHKQFQGMFQSIEQSQIIETLGVSRDMNKHIAEFGTGTWLMCDNYDSGAVLIRVIVSVTR